MVEAASRGISIHYLSRAGRPDVRIGRLAAPEFSLTVAQVRLAQSAGGLRLARSFVRGKVRNQQNLLRYFLKYRTRAGQEQFRAAGELALAKMETLDEDLRGRSWTEGVDFKLERDRIFASEGQSAGWYWSALKELLRSRASFGGRVRMGAKDLVNSLLNYGYGILYARLHHVLVTAGLNPNVSFLHTPRPGKPTLVFDFIEEFRAPAVDRVVCALLGKRATLTISDEGLPMETRQRLARAVLDGLQSEVRYHGRMVRLEEAMEIQARRLTRHIEDKEEYEPYVMAW